MIHCCMFINAIWCSFQLQKCPNDLNMIWICHIVGLENYECNPPGFARLSSHGSLKLEPIMYGLTCWIFLLYTSNYEVVRFSSGQKSYEGIFMVTYVIIEHSYAPCNHAMEWSNFPLTSDILSENDQSPPQFYTPQGFVVMNTSLHYSIFIKCTINPPHCYFINVLICITLHLTLVISYK